MSDLSRNAYEQYKAKWLEENDVCNGDAHYVCYREFMNNEYQDEEIMKYYLDEETLKEYRKSMFNNREEFLALERIYNYLKSVSYADVSKNDLKCLYQVYLEKRYQIMAEDIEFVLEDGGAFDGYSDAKEKDNLIDTVINFFEHRDVMGAARAILNYMFRGEFDKTEEYIRISESIGGFTSVMFNNCFIIPADEPYED